MSRTWASFSEGVACCVAAAMARLWFISAALFISAVAGCRETEPPRTTIRGVVSYKGKPVEFGDIVFQPADPQWKRFYAQGKIVGGKYELVDRGPIVGANRVEIFGYKRTGRKKMEVIGKSLSEPVEVVEETVPYIPPEFNEDSKLTYEIKPGDNVDVDFHL